MSAELVTSTTSAVPPGTSAAAACYTVDLQIGEHDTAPFVREGLAEHEAETAGGAGDEDDLPIEIEVHDPSCRGAS